MPLPTKAKLHLNSHSGRVNCAKFNAEGEYILSGSSDKNIKLWNSSGVCIKTYSAHGYEVLSLDIATDNSKFCSGGGDKAVFLWDVVSAKVIRRFTGHHQRLNDVAFNKEASIICSASYDASVRIWDCRAPIQVLDEAKDSVSSVVITDHEILTGSIDGKLRIYDIRVGSLITDHVGAPVTCARFSGDKNCILTSTLDSSIKLFDKENGELLSEYQGHVNTNYKLTSTLTNDDSCVISGSEDGKIYFWELVDGKVMECFQAHSKAVLSVEYHPKEDVILSASADGTITVFST